MSQMHDSFELFLRAMTNGSKNIILRATHLPTQRDIWPDRSMAQPLNHDLRLVRGACHFKTYLNPTLSKAPKKETDFLRPQRESRDTGEQNRHENPITRTAERSTFPFVGFFLPLLLGDLNG